MKIEYTIPGPADSAEILALMPALYRQIGGGLAGVLEEFLSSDRYFKMLAVEKGSGAPAGFMVGCCRLEVDFECRAGIIEEILVLPAYQKLGIGKALLAEFEKWCAARGAQGILVPCGRPGFYEKMGFEKLPVIRYWKEFTAAPGAIKIPGAAEASE
jgi:GNAT superfamily N-acetyltransferase